jgi:hypothetical protein
MRASEVQRKSRWGWIPVVVVAGGALELEIIGFGIHLKRRG